MFAIVIFTFILNGNIKVLFLTDVYAYYSE